MSFLNPTPPEDPGRALPASWSTTPELNDKLEELLGRSVRGVSDLHWLANESPERFGADVFAFYSALDRSGLLPFVPLDWQRAVLRG